MLIVLIILTGVLSLISYTLVDLNLTLLNWQPYLALQKQFTELGYFHRQTNALIWIAVLGGLASSYIMTVLWANQGKYSYKKILYTAWIIAGITILGYNALSHDLFNYMFDAKIITTYHLNPYMYKALDFPQDPWIRFMQWTHRTYPYGPGWLALTYIPSLVGMGKFLPTVILFRSLFALFYITTCIFLGKVADELKIKKEVVVALFAFHPLIILDGLISPRIDMAMICFGVIGIYFMITNKRVIGIASLLFSALIKFATIVYIPIMLMKKGNIKWQVYALCVASSIGTIAQTIYSNELQPWYLLGPISTAPLLLVSMKVKHVLAIQSVGLVSILLYIYFIYTGSWFSVI